MNQGESDAQRRDFRVLTRVYPSGRPQEIESVVPLHPKVEAYLSARTDALRFAIYDRVHDSFCVYDTSRILRRKIYYVPYHTPDDGPMMLGAGKVMIFDQVTGELLYDGSDGGE
jgi:hypothetical protein